MPLRRKWTLTLVALPLSLLALEASARIVFADELDEDAIRERRAAANLSALLQPSEEDAFGVELRRGLDLRFRGAHVVTDADGCRVRVEAPDHLPGLPPDATPLRVAVVGASTTFGYGVREEQTWPERLVPFLESQWRRPVTLRNFSVPSWNAEQQAAGFAQRVLPWRPEFVLWHYDHRDAFPRIDDTSTAEPPPEYGDNALGSAALKLVLRSLRRRELAEQLAAGRDGTRSEEGYFTAGPDHARHLQALRQAQQVAQLCSVPILLVIFDADLARAEAGRHHFEQLHAPLVPQLQAAGFRVLDLFPAFQAQMERQGWPDLKPFWRTTVPPDPHPNTAGHEFIADAVARQLLVHPDWLAAMPPIEEH